MKPFYKWDIPEMEYFEKVIFIVVLFHTISSAILDLFIMYLVGNGLVKWTCFMAVTTLCYNINVLLIWKYLVCIKNPFSSEETGRVPLVFVIKKWNTTLTVREVSNM